MITEAFTWPMALLLANSLIVLCFGIVVLRLYREMRASRNFWQGPAAAALQAEPYDDRSLRRMVDRRMTMLEKFVGQQVQGATRPAAEPLSSLPLQKHELPVDYAVRMAQRGASINDLVRGCGLNKGEAQLLMRLHAGSTGPRQNAATH